MVPWECWTVAALQPDGTYFAYRLFESEASAIASLQTDPERGLRLVLRDKLEMPIWGRGRPASTPAEFTWRENWLGRFRKELAHFYEAQCRAVVWDSQSNARPEESQFGGLPLLLQTQQWPRCGECELPKSYVGRLSLVAESQLRAKADALQLFYCLHCPDSGSVVWTNLGDRPEFRNASDVRLIHLPKKGIHLDTSEYKYDWAAESALRQTADRPELLGSELRYRFRVLSTKVGGSPHWIQSPVQLPRACTCESKLVFFGQLAGHENVSFGDMGIVYVFGCLEGSCQSAHLITQSS